MRKNTLFNLSLLLALSFSWLFAAGRNVAPDALSRATTWNSFAGDLTVLSDNQVPGAGEAAPFTWQTKGILVFEWDEVLPLEKVRVYVGEIANNYQVRAYIGGHLEENGALRDPEGERTALVQNDDRLPDAWIEIPLPEGTRADNIELWTLGTTVFYEVEILVRTDDTAVKKMSWATLKARVANQP